MIDVLSYRQWAISQQFANSFGLIALKLLSEGKSIDHLIKKHSNEALRERYDAIAASSDGLITSTEWDRESRLEVATTKNGQNVAIIPVIGALTKRGDLCTYGMRDYIGMIERANKSQKIAAILLDIESPGGTVDGTNEFGMAVKGSKKPVVAFGDGMVASAAYWVASQAREIIANKNNSTEFGSIGVLYIHENYQAYIQKEIGSVEIIRAPQSVDKARVNVIEPITEDQRLEIKQELKDIAKEFISTVKKGRGAKLNTGEENIFTGKMYPSTSSLNMGMIDKLDTIQGAINRAGELAFSPSTSSSARAQVNTQMKFPLISALFGKSEKATSAEQKSASEESLSVEEQASMEAAEKKLAEMETENSTLKATNEAGAKKIAELEASVSGQLAQITALTDEKTKLTEENAEQKRLLEVKPTGEKTTVVSDDGKEASQASDDKEVKAKSFRSSADDESDKYLKATQQTLPKK